MRNLTAAAFVVALMLLFAGDAFAGIKSGKFMPAMVKGRQVDWCLKFGSQCGKPAADAFCKARGYDKATKFTNDPTPKLPTLVLGTNQTCTEPGKCVGLGSVKCVAQTSDGNFDDDVGMNPVGEHDSNQGSGNQPLGKGDKLEGDMVIHVYNNPQWKGAALDWCKVVGGECGKPAADQFCQSKGFAGSTKRMKGSQPQVTRIISNGEICSDDSCRAITYIKCARSKNG